MRSNAMVVLGLFVAGVALCGCDEEGPATAQLAQSVFVPGESAAMRENRYRVLGRGFERAGDGAEARLHFRFPPEARDGPQKLREQLWQPWKVSSVQAEASYVEVTITAPLPDSVQSLFDDTDRIVERATSCGAAIQASGIFTPASTPSP